MDERHLRTLLRDEADRHQPDRAAMLGRIGRSRAAAAERPMARARVALSGSVRVRPTAAAFAVVLLLVLGIMGTRMFRPGPATTGTPAAAPVTPTPAPSAARSTLPVVTAPGTTGRPDPPGRTSGPSAAATAGGPASAPVGGTAPPVRDGFLAAAGVLDPYSKAGWSQSDLTLTTAETLTTLKVTVRIAHTAGVADTGHWTSIPGGQITTTVTMDDHELVYRFALADGVTLTPGKYTFAVQYHHTGVRAPAGDSYLAAGRGVSKEKAEVTGTFKIH
jgi:hypothetical protein